MIKHIMLDLDNTILDSETAVSQLFKDANDSSNTHLNSVDFRAAFRMSCLQHRHLLLNFDIIEKIGIGSYDCFFINNFSPHYEQQANESLVLYREAVLRSVSIELSIDIGTTQRIANYLYQNWLRYFNPYPNAINFLSKLSAIKNVYFVTNGFIEIQSKKIQKHSFDRLVKNIFISEQYRIGKPYKEFYDNILLKLNTKPDDCIMIGDNLENDINAAKILGIHTIHFKYDPQNPIPYSYENTTYQAYNFEGILKLINKISH